MRNDVDAQRSIAARLERLPVTWTHIKSRLVVGTATFFDAFDAISLASVLPVVAAAWKLHPTEIGILISAGNLGQFCGALGFPWLADRIGRLKGLYYSALLFSLASLLCGLSWAYPVLLMARFVQGIGTGGEVPVAAAYINEIAKAKHRGRFFLLYETIFPIGLIAAGLVGSWVVPNFGWQWLFFIGAIPAVVALVIRRRLPESPRWLANRGKIGAADRIVRSMEVEAEAKLGHPLPPPNLEGIGPISAAQASWTELFRPPYRVRTFTIWAIWFCSFFTTQGLNAWLPTIYKTVFNLGVQEALLLGVVTTSAGVLSNLAVAFLVDWTGRRLWLSVALPLGGVSLLTLALFGMGSAAALSVAATAAFFFLSSVSVMLYLYTPELYPTRIRALGTGMSAAMRNIAATISPIAVGIVLSSSGFEGVLVMFGIMPVIAGAIVMMFTIETKGRALEDLSP